MSKNSMNKNEISILRVIEQNVINGISVNDLKSKFKRKIEKELNSLIQKGYISLDNNKLVIRDNYSSGYLKDFFKYQNTIYQSIDREIALRPENNLTVLFFKDIIWKFLKEKNLLITVFGETGSGKSLVAISLALFITRYSNFLKLNGEYKIEFDVINDIKDSNQQILEHLALLHKEHRLYKGYVCIKDETDQNKAGFGQFTAHINMKDLRKRFRADIVCIIDISPTKFDAEQNASHFTLETDGAVYSRIPGEEHKIISVRLLVRDIEGILRGHIFIKPPPQKYINKYKKNTKKDILNNSYVQGGHAGDMLDKCIDILEENKEMVYMRQKIHVGDFWNELVIHGNAKKRLMFMSKVFPFLVAERHKALIEASLREYMVGPLDD